MSQAALDNHYPAIDVSHKTSIIISGAFLGLWSQPSNCAWLQPCPLQVFGLYLLSLFITILCQELHLFSCIKFLRFHPKLFNHIWMAILDGLTRFLSLWLHSSCLIGDQTRSSAPVWELWWTTDMIMSLFIWTRLEAHYLNPLCLSQNRLWAFVIIAQIF